VTRWQLTPRQGEVLGLVSRGLANATIAAALGCGDRAVELHLTALFDRAGVESRAALVARVLTQDSINS
jgi:DNA-binding NarL/FixJ family response regulator